MTEPQSQHTSPWLDTMSRPELGDTSFRSLQADVVVVGAGITGITSALYLQQEGMRVAVVDAGRLGQSVTTRSTVKITVGQGTMYSAIAEARGVAAAQTYADANVAGMQGIFDLVGSLGIDCMLEQGLPHVIYGESPEDVPKIEREARLADQLGLPVALVEKTHLPFEVSVAASFSDQAQFHPGQYLAGLAGAFVASGGVILEEARATGVKTSSGGCQIETEAGELEAAHVVVATQYPFLDRGGQFTQLKARRTYGIAGVLPAGALAGMTINVGSPTRSTRRARLGDRELLIVVGEGHQVGHAIDTAPRWERLRDWARERFGVADFRYHWSAEEVSTLDKVPFVGAIAPRSERVLIATGFDGWGMTNGTAAAMMLRDTVLGRSNPWIEVFDARRALRSIPPVKAFIAHNARVARTWLRDRLGGAEKGDPTQLQPGDAAILDVDGEQTAAYRDEGGHLHAVSAVCTHLGCTVEWNAGETSWDCPCHGSRFSCDGAVLHGPASIPLERRQVREAQSEEE